MITNESLPVGSFSEQDINYLHDLEESMRPKDRIQKQSEELLRTDPELYQEISNRSIELAPGDPTIHSFYFTEFVIMYQSVKNALKM